MTKGFGKQLKQLKGDGISIESIVSARSGEPLIKLEWGRQSGLLSPQEARVHAFKILEAAAADMDAILVKWTQQELGMQLPESAYLRRLFRQKRDEGKLPSCTMNFDGDDRMTPDEVRSCAVDMLFMAFHTEAEAFLVEFLLQEVGCQEEQVNAVIEALREMRGLKRIDEVEDK